MGPKGPFWATSPFAPKGQKAPIAAEMGPKAPFRPQGGPVAPKGPLARPRALGPRRGPRALEQGPGAKGPRPLRGREQFASQIARSPPPSRPKPKASAAQSSALSGPSALKGQGLGPEGAQALKSGQRPGLRPGLWPPGTKWPFGPLRDVVAEGRPAVGPALSSSRRPKVIRNFAKLD